MTDEEVQKEKRRLLSEARADLLKRQLSNAENYDRAILNVSTAFLGFSFLAAAQALPPGGSLKLWNGGWSEGHSGDLEFSVADPLKGNSYQFDIGHDLRLFEFFKYDVKLIPD